MFFLSVWLSDLTRPGVKRFGGSASGPGEAESHRSVSLRILIGSRGTRGRYR